MVDGFPGGGQGLFLGRGGAVLTRGDSLRRPASSTVLRGEQRRRSMFEEEEEDTTWRSVQVPAGGGWRRLAKREKM